MKLRLLSIILGFLIAISVLYGCTEQKENLDTIIVEYDDTTLDSRFGFMHPDDFNDMTDLGIFWQRPHPGPFVWGQVETKSGIYNWNECDDEVKRSQQYGVNIIATIWPFADWEQSNCHSKAGSLNSMIFSELGEYRQKPCDIDVYKNFISKLVERYDGDGIDDMPDLVVPIKYWEVSNEPSMQEDFHTFFLGSAQDYFDILIATYESVKDTDSAAIVIQGGMAGVMEDNTKFWSEVFDLGGSSYFDIANIHSINSESEGINGPEFREFIDSQSIDKPFWITEVEIGLMNQDKTEYADEGMADKMITNFVLAFESGAEKIFHPSIMKKAGENEKMQTYNALQTIVDKLNYFDSVEKLDEGQYKFSLKNDFVYVLWGEGAIPEEINGQIKKTDVSGVESIISSDELILSESPIFVEIV